MSVIADVMDRKAGELHTIPAEASVLAATQLMNEQMIGALVVTEEDRIVGIFTERDVLRRVVARELRPSEVAVADVMTTEVLCCRPETTIDEARHVMKHQRVRHLPVIDDDGNALGMISIGDLNASQCDDQEYRIHFLQDYIYGRV